MQPKETKGKGAAASFENGDAVFAAFFEWLLARPAEEREAVLRDGITVRRLVEEIATRKEVTPRLRARGKNGPSPSAYAYAITACLRRRDYFLFRDPEAKEALEGEGSDFSAYRKEGILDAALLVNPVSRDARARGFAFARLLDAGGGAPPAGAPRARAASRRAEPEAPREIEPEEEAQGAEEEEEDLEEGSAEGGEEEGEEFDEEPSHASITPSAGRPRPAAPERPGARSLPPAFQTAAPGWQTRPARGYGAAPPAMDYAGTQAARPAARPWGSPREAYRPGGFGHGEPRGRGFGPPRREAPAAAPRLPVPPPPPLPKRSAAEILADYLASSAGPPLVQLARAGGGRPRYAGWTADFGREIAPGKRGLDLRTERDLVALLFLGAAASLTGGYRSATDLLAGLLGANLVSMSFWRDEGTLLRVGAPKRIPFPQPLQIALHVIARNEAEIREAFRFDDILAGKRPALDVEKVYRTLMSDKMELPRYWRGPFKRNRRHRKLLPSRLGRVIVVRIPTLLRELHLQGAIEVDPAECCAADKPVRRAMYAAGIPVKKPVNRMLSLRENSRAIHAAFGELFEMPLLLYGRAWRRA